MKANIFKKITAIICIIALILPISSEVLAKITETAKGTEQKFGIVHLHTSKYLNGSGTSKFGYKVGNRLVYRIYAGEDNDDGYANTVLCLDKYGKFPSEESTTDKYTSLGEATSEVLQKIKTTQSGALTNLTAEESKKIIWLMNNAVLPEDSKELQEVKLAKIFANVITVSNETQNPITLEYIKSILTEDDLVFALQASIWSITNKETNQAYSGTTDGERYNTLSGNDVITDSGKKGSFINIIIDYYKNNCASNENIVKSTQDGAVEPRIVKPSQKLRFTNMEISDEDKQTVTEGTIDTGYMFVGPFKIEPSQTGKSTVDYSVNITFQDATGKEINTTDYFIKDSNKMAGNSLRQTKEELEGKEFYIAVRKGTTIRKINIKLNSASIISDSTPTAWAVENNNLMQPLISAKRTENKTNPVEDNYEFEAQFDRKYDLALRKFISAVWRKNASGYWQVIPIDSRVPTEEKTGKEDANQYNYKHQKDAVELEVGDIVEYTLRVYNEGKYDVRLTQVIDYLPPSGLEFLENGWKDENHTTNYDSNKAEIEDFSKESSQIIIKPKTNTNGIGEGELLGTINLQNETDKKLGAWDIKLQFKVTEEAKGKTITNIAEITGFLGENDSDGDGNGDGVFAQQEESEGSIKNVILPTTEEEWENYKGNKSNKDELNDKEYYYQGQEDDDDFEKIIVPGEYKPDVALRKSIIAVNGKTLSRAKAPDTTPLKNETATTSNFTDLKDPVRIKAGDKITYTIRVFNEGSQDMYATKIADYIPEGLGFLPNYQDNITNKWITSEDERGTVKKLSEIENATSNFSNSDFDTSMISDYKEQTVICGKAKIESTKLQDTKLSKYDKETDKLQIETLQITCVVLDTVEPETIIRNIAAVTGYADENKQQITTKEDETDSEPGNDLSNFNENNHEDDEDFEKLILELKEVELPYDLALKKYVSSVTDGTNNAKPIANEEKRELRILSVENLKQRQNVETKADATYTFGLEKEQVPVSIEKGDYVTYTIRIYNEGLVDAKVGEIIDSIPEELTFMSDSSINKKYGWKEYKDETATGWKEEIKTTILENTTLPAFDPNKENETSFDSNTGIGIDKGISYAEVKIEFKVNDKAKYGEPIKNIAEITKDDGDDNDSDPDNKDPEEDDEDFDLVVPTRFDLSLRKFITQIGEKEITDRVPKVDTTELDNGTSTTAKYQHPKQEDIKVVVKGQVVVYTLRIYNEGTKDGYASEIKDDIPEGLTFLPDNEINKTNRWKMYDKDGKETDDVTKAVEIRTDAKSKENGTEKTGEADNSNPYYKSNTNIIRAYDPKTMKNGPDYVDVQVAFKVTKENVTDGQSIIINTAEITKETDKNGTIIKDDDSVPDNNEPEEDDIDKEYIQLKYFDLSLLKYVSKVIVTEDGVTKETETGYDGTENPEPVVKVELNKQKLSKTQVNYLYTIKITNEGQIEGYAKEITDRIPDGLAFYEEDNKEWNWKIKEDGIVTTDYLKDKLLKPGESATVPIMLRWENSETNLGQKINVAEISKDENEYGVPDIDSTPNNNVDGEDDQDNAIVVLSINTGSAPLYIVLITIITAIIGSGVYLIYKYVVKK